MTKQTKLIAFGDIEALLNLLKNAGMTEKQVATAIGYTDGAIPEMRRAGHTRYVNRYALLGLIAEREGKLKPLLDPQHIKFDFEQCEFLFELLKQARKSWPGRERMIAQVQTIVVREMMRQTEGN